MATFKDSANREWLVSIDTLQLRRVREATKFELAKLLADKMRLLQEIAADPELLASVLFVLCREQVTKLGVTEEQFFAGLAGDPLAEAFDAFIQAYADFSPSHLRKLLLTMVKKQKEYVEERTAEAVEKLEAPNETVKNSPTDSPESSELIPVG
jgi:hypothetical protein